MINRTLRTASVCELATDRETLRAELLRLGAHERVASCLTRVIYELATNGACYGAAPAIVVCAQRVDLLEIRIPGEPFDSVSAARAPEARGLADAAHLLHTISWSWDWRWSGERGEPAAASGLERENVIRLWSREEG